jgi:outer membrane receptor protein involved in Fe transport
MKKAHQGFFFLAFFAIPSIVFAQFDTTSYDVDVLSPENLIELQTNTDIEIVSASRNAKKLEDLPVTIQVITREEILLNGYVTLTDVLKSLPGIRVSQPGSGELGEMFILRGMLGNDYIKILIDNIPIKPSVLSGFPIESQLPIRQAERIEVVYGPASAVYGADATIGVINIITKRADQGIFSEADFSLGSGGYSYINFHAGGKAGRNKNILNYSFYGSKANFENMNIFNDSTVYNPLDYLEQKGVYWLNNGDTITPSELTPQLMSDLGLPPYVLLPSNYEGTLTMPEISSIPSQSHIIGLDLNYRGFGLSYRNMSRKTHSSIGKTPYLYKYNNPQNFIGDIMNQVTFSYAKDINRLYTSTNLSFLRYTMDNNSSYGETFIPGYDKVYQYSSSNDIFAEEVLTYYGKFFELTGGLSLQLSQNIPATNYLYEPYDKASYYDVFENPANYHDFESFGLNSYEFINISEFVQSYFVLKNITVMGGVRHDYNSMYDASSVNPRVAVLYKLNPKTAFTGSYGRAFKAPAGNTLYHSLAFQVGVDSIVYNVIPNTNLKPEFFRAYELGINRKLFKEKVLIKLAFYYNKTDNIISTAYIDSADLTYDDAVNTSIEPARTYVNSVGAESKLFGLDGSIIIYNPLNKYKLRIELNSTATKGKEILPDGSIIDFFRTMPSYIGKANIRISPSRRTYILVHATWNGRVQKLFNTDYVSFLHGKYSETNGFFSLDLAAGLRLHKNLNIIFKVTNVLNKEYAGINSTGYDVDLRYNPQLGRNFRIGMNFIIN